MGRSGGAGIAGRLVGTGCWRCVDGLCVQAAGSTPEEQHVGCKEVRSVQRRVDREAEASHKCPSWDWP